MMNTRLLLASLALAALASVAWADSPSASLAPTKSVLAITQPSKDVTLTFSRPGRIAELLVQEGQQVKENQPVVQQDDREEKAQLAIDTAKANDITEIEAQKAVRDQKEVDYKRILDAFKNGGVKSQLEVDSARIEVVINDARLKISQFDHEQNQRKVAQTQVIVDKMLMHSPIAGTVEQTMVKAGESVELNTKVIRIVNVNPLWIEAPVPLAQARKLAKDAPAKVTFVTDKAAAEGKIVYIRAVADPGSDTLMIRVEIPNPALRSAGEQVTVEFPAAVVSSR